MLIQIQYNCDKNTVQIGAFTYASLLTHQMHPPPPPSALSGLTTMMIMMAIVKMVMIDSIAVSVFVVILVEFDKSKLYGEMSRLVVVVDRHVLLKPVEGRAKTRNCTSSRLFRRLKLSFIL